MTLGGRSPLLLPGNPLLPRAPKTLVTPLQRQTTNPLYGPFAGPPGCMIRILDAQSRKDPSTPVAHLISLTANHLHLRCSDHCILCSVFSRASSPSASLSRNSRNFATRRRCGHNRHICAVFTGVPTKTDDPFVSAILSGHCIVACMACCARWSLEFLLRPPKFVM